MPPVSAAGGPSGLTRVKGPPIRNRCALAAALIPVAHPVLIAIGINWEGKREVLGVEPGAAAIEIAHPTAGEYR